MRKSGIAVIGDIPWGTHFSQFYETKKDLIDILVPYFKAGLDSNEFCMWITSDALKAKEAETELRKEAKNLDKYIKKGQIEILEAEQWYTRNGKFETDRVLKSWLKKEKNALKRGFDGVRISGNTFWLGRSDWKPFLDYERKVQNLIGNHRMIAVCSYSLRKCGPLEALDVANRHQFALIRKNGRWRQVENSEQKRREKSLLDSERQYRKIFDFSPLVIGVVDRAGNLLDINQRLCEWLGYGRDEVIGKHFLRLPFLTDQSKSIAREKLSRFVQGKQLSPYELEFVTKDGQRRVGRVTSNPIKNEKSKLTEILVMASDITERRKAEKALTESEELFRSIVESSHAGILIADDSYRFVYVNDELCRMLGYCREEVIGQDFRKFLDEESQQIVAERYIKRQRGEKVPPRYEFNVVHKNGEKRRVEIISTLIRDKSGQVRTLAQILDITERKKAEERLRLEKTYLDRLFEGAQEGIVMADKRGKVIRVNDEFVRMFGYEPDEVLGRSVDDLVATKDYHNNAELITKKTARGEKFALEAVRQRKDGKMIDVSILTSPIIIGGDLAAVFGIYRDITERKRAELALRVSEEKYRNLVELSPDAILFLDMDGMVTSCNTFMIKATGYSREEIVGKNIRELEFLPDEDILKYIKLINKAAKGIVPKPFEVIWHHKDGTSYLAEVRVGFIKENRKNVGLQVVTRDMTERKKAEEMIKTSLKEKEVMLREIHHRVKNNMQIISSLLRLQSRQITNEKILDMFNVGQNRIRSMALIHESLYKSNDLARINFSDYIKRLTTHLFSIYRTERDSVNLRLDVKDVFLDINRAIPCGLVINELVSNSLKHAFPDGNKGEIVVEMDENKRGQYTLIVSDSGIGFPEGLDFQNTETLGMQLVTDLVRQLDGRIKLSRLKGTAFKIAF